MKQCNDCALKTMLNGMCPVFSADMSDKEGCPYFTNELHLCDVCGHPIINVVYVEQDENEKWHKLCADCVNAPPCKTCVHRYCAFQQDTSCPEPQTVMREIRQGNMIMQAQVLNPKRIEATCRKGCPCFNEDGLDDGTYCGRQNAGCGKYRTQWRN